MGGFPISRELIFVAIIIAHRARIASALKLFRNTSVGTPFTSDLGTLAYSKSQTVERD